jgi:hypothetical protein
LKTWAKFGWMIFAAWVQVASISAQTPPRFPSTIKSVTAKLYYSNSGTFSKNILDDPDIGLWNTIIGEGSAGSPSDATLIEVEVDGDGGPNVIHKEHLTITVQPEGKPPITRHIGPLYIEESGKHFEAVWLYDSGCLPVAITVQLDNQPIIRKKIDFECGE